MPTAKRTAARPPKIISSHRADRQPRRYRRQGCSNAEMTRRYVILIVIVLIAASAISSIWTPVALTILEKLLPTLTLMCGYYYRQRHA